MLPHQEAQNRLTRIGIFYDGGFFSHVSNYYLYHHERRARISINGLHRFVRDEVAKREETAARYCQIVDAHYFRGRFSAHDAQERDSLYRERVFDDILTREGVVAHYLPMRSGSGEKGIDVWFALEAFELATYKRFNVCVLIACDGDYVPLARKLNTIGARVMVLGWDFEYTDQNGNPRETRTAQNLLDEVTYPILMQTVIDDRSRRNDPVVNNLFLPRKERIQTAAASSSTVQASDGAAGAGEGAAEPDTDAEATVPVEGTVQNMKNGYGFITSDAGGENLFFFHADVINLDFNDLVPGDRIQFVRGTNDKGPCARQVTRIASVHEQG